MDRRAYRMATHAAQQHNKVSDSGQRRSIDDHDDEDDDDDDYHLILNQLLENLREVVEGERSTGAGRYFFARLSSVLLECTISKGLPCGSRRGSHFIACRHSWLR